MDPKAPASSGNSDVSPVSCSNAHYTATVPANACTKLTTCIKTHVFHIRTKPRDDGHFDVRVRPIGTFPRSSFTFKNWAMIEIQEMGSIPRKTLTTGPERDCEEITLRFETDSTTIPVDSDYSSNDETFGRSKLE